MASRGPGNGVRKPASPKTVRPAVAAASVATAAPVPVAPAAEAEPAAPPPVPFVVAPAADPVELPVQIEAAIAAAADTGEQVVQTVSDTAADAVHEATGAVDAVAQQVEEDTMTYEANATIENTTAKAQNVMADMNEKAKTAMEKGAKGFEEMNDMAKGNVEAMVEASRIAAKGLETLGQEMAEYGRKSFESATAAAKTLATVKSPTEFMKLQSDFVRQSFDSFVAEASKTTEMMMKLAGDAAQPISNRVAIAADKVKVSA